MPTIYDKRENAIKYKVKKGDTLATIAAAYRGKSSEGVDISTWKDLAQFNFGTTGADEVNRALLETVGCSHVKATDPSQTELNPDPSVPGEILIPKTWKQDKLAMRKRHTIKVKRSTPPTAISITNLDKWFIPDVETCDVRYSIEGDPEFANKIDFVVYGSNYCECTDWKDGWGTYSALDNEPLFQEEKMKAPEPGNHLLEVTKDKGKLSWRGEVNTEKGVLAKKKDVKDERFVNVAFSPYTLLLRHYKTVADNKARIELTPFWPIFKTDGSPKEATTEIKWKIAESKNKLKQGLLTIWDKFDTVVFSKPLKESDLGDGEHSFKWDWKYSINAKTAKAEEMPYRVQIQGHTPMNTEEGLALAAMHTEVRLYVHPKTHATDLDPYVAKTNKSSLVLQLADVWHKDEKPKKADDGKIWTKFELANAGFHPGPVMDATVSDEFKIALHEFQKSVPKKKTGAKFERLTVSDNDDTDTRDALEALEAKRKRPWFGKADDRTDYARNAQELEKDLKDPEKDVVVWVDDRYWYADAGWVPEDGTSVRSDVSSHATGLTEARGGYAIGDARVAYDKRDIARPWLPFEVRVLLLSKQDTLSDEKGSEGVTERQWKAIQAAIGPLRVDWTFDEIEGDTLDVSVIETAMYDKERTRSKKAVEWLLDDRKATHTRKDVKKESKYYNCLETFGGVRPDTTANYFKAVFGLDTKSLHPWKAKPDTTKESVVTVVHTDLGEKHNKDDKFTKRMGRSGVYFNPSNMAGDGYQIRAEVRFEENADYKFPNAKTLEGRYPKMPQAHSAKMRLWRKASLRGYVCWGPNDSFSGSIDNYRRIYRASHMHFINENGVADGSIHFTASTLFTDLTRYRNMVRELVNPAIAAPGNVRRLDANITVTADRMWPWHGHNQLAIVEASTPLPPAPPPTWNTAWTAAHKIYGDHAANYYYRLSVRLSSEIARLLEEEHGYMRGNVILEMQSSSQVDYRVYQCTTCNDYYVYLEKNGVAATHLNASCPTPLCAGTLNSIGVQKYRDNLPVPSLGNPIGVAINFHGGYELWAHEIGHTRYMEHAGNAPASRGGATAAAMRDLVHDSVPNPAMSADPVPEARRWDRACLMTYASHLANFDAVKDRTYLCYKCILKNRGWKIENIPNTPPGNVKDD
jgi:hypothetical protein